MFVLVMKTYISREIHFKIVALYGSVETFVVFLLEKKQISPE